MPLQLLDYSQLSAKGNSKSISPGGKMYRDFGEKIITVLQDGLKYEREKGTEVYECTLMADLRVMKRLLGEQYSVSCIPIEKVFPRNILLARIQTKRRTCILLGVTRFFIIREHTLP
ncbi:hypothetical protein KBD33_01955 [Candidatus Gracilibacteria bacterium]|nr:hypothetical protein [Candidatus Gracilibacteria bacterium]